MKHGKILLMLSVLVIMALGCTTEPKREKVESTWIDASVSVNAGDLYSTSKTLQEGDSVTIVVTLTQGDYIAEVLLADSTNYDSWLKDESFASIFDEKTSYGVGTKVRIPASGKYYFAVWNNALLATIKVDVFLSVFKWQ